MEIDFNEIEALSYLNGLSKGGCLTVWDRNGGMLGYIHKFYKVVHKNSEVRMEVGISQITLRQKVYDTLIENGWNKTKTAEALGFGRKKLNNLIEKSQLKKDEKAMVAIQAKQKLDLLEALEKTSWNYNAAAQVLGIDPKTVSRKIKKLFGNQKKRIPWQVGNNFKKLEK